MNKINILTKRNLKEIIRDPLSLVFCIAFPVAMLLIMPIMFSNMPEVPEIFSINNYSVGICIFGYTFSMLFVALLISGDKNTEFINRLNMAPISKSTYLASYFIALLPITFVQTVLFFAISLIFGLSFNVNLLVAIVYLLPSAVFYISLGALIGTLAKTEKQAGPLCSVFVTATTMFGGVFMPINQLGTFGTVLQYLPFSHTVDIATGVINGNFASIYPHIFWIIAYTVLICFVTALIYKIKK